MNCLKGPRNFLEDVLLLWKLQPGVPGVAVARPSSPSFDQVVCVQFGEEGQSARDACSEGVACDRTDSGDADVCEEEGEGGVELGHG